MGEVAAGVDVLVQGRYRLGARLGEGAMAVVYEADDLQMKRKVAVKLVASPSPDLARRFEREARAVAQLSHPNVVTVYDAGTHDGRLFLVMEQMRGGTLASVAKPGARRDDLVALLEKAARGVHHAHERGIVHRDLKPGNILLSADGVPKIADFGLARVSLPDEPGLSRSGVAIGTPHYMSPEQVAGRPRGIDARTDVYALGAVLYELLAGRPPHEAASVTELYHRILTEEPQPPSRLRRGVSPDLDIIALKALEKEPERRYSTAAAFADDLLRYLRGEAIEARPSSWAYRLRKRVRRHPAASVLSGVLGLSLVAGPALLVALQRHAERRAAAENIAEAERLVARLPADRGAAVSRLIEADGRLRAAEHLGGAAREARYRVNLRLGDLALEGDDYGLARLAYAACADLRPSEGAALSVRVDERERALARRREERIREALADIRAGLSRRDRPRGAPLLDDYVAECTRYDDEQTVALLGSELAGFARRAAAGDVDWSAEDRDVMAFACRVLSRLQRDSAVEPLGRLLAEARDRRVLIECGIALCNTRSAAAWGPLLRLHERLGDRSPRWISLLRHMARLPEPAGVPRTAGEYARRALIRDCRGDHPAALDDIAQAIALEPGHAAHHLRRAFILDHARDLEAVIEAAASALAIDDRRAEAWAVRASARFSKGDAKGAIEDGRRALELDGTYWPAYLTSGSARCVLGELTAAIADFDAALRIEPEAEPALVNRASARYALGDFRAATRDLTLAIDLAPHNARLRQLRGQARAAGGARDEALEDYARAIEMDPQLAAAYMSRARLRLLMGGEAQAAERDLRRFLELEPEGPLAEDAHRMLERVRVR